MQIKQKVNEKQSRDFGRSLLHVPLNLALVKNTESLSIMNSSQSEEGDMRGNQTPFFPCEPLSIFGAYCISRLFSERTLSLSDR